MIERPQVGEYDPYYEKYISLFEGSDLLEAIEGQIREMLDLVSTVPPDRENYRYAENKWSIREVLGHLIDSERIFGYRAFCISRGETAPLPWYDENEYVARSGYGERTLADLLSELTMLRDSNLAFLRRLKDEDWTRTGTACNRNVSVRALIFILAGHLYHHVAVLRDKYGLATASDSGR
jgi:hypothetical protein